MRTKIARRLHLSLSPDVFPSIPAQLKVAEDDFLAAHQQASVISVRLNPRKPTNVFAEAERVPWCAAGRYLVERPAFIYDPLLHAGCYYVQEASSMFLAEALRQHVDLSRKLCVLDLCAAPGGKSTSAASLLSDESLLLSNEVMPNRASVLCENLVKWGQSNTWVSQSDPKQFGALGAMFDVLLVDAPCSGSGLFRKQPDFAAEWNLDLVNQCATRQQKILQDAMPSLQQEGLLVYMTCSFCAEENEQMVDWILATGEYESLPMKEVSRWGILETQSELHGGYGYRFFPHLLKGEGFFLSVFRKTASSFDHTPSVDARMPMSKSEAAILANYMDMEGMLPILHHDQLMVIQEAHYPYLKAFRASIKLIKRGMLAGKMIRNELIPDHELALSTSIRKSLPAVELSKEEALTYLRRGTLCLDTHQKGWLLARYQQQNLGWVKHLGNRTNNYYPTHYRILT